MIPGDLNTIQDRRSLVAQEFGMSQILLGTQAVSSSIKFRVNMMPCLVVATDSGVM